MNGNCEVEKALIMALESQGVGVVAVFTESVGRSGSDSLPTSEAISKFLVKGDGKPLLDALVNLQFALLSSGGAVPTN